MPSKYRAVQKKRSILFFLPTVWFRRYCIGFQVVKTVGLGNCSDSKMDGSGRYTVQQQIKIVETYFATKLVVLTQQQCRKELGRDKVPDRKTIERLVAKFRETGSVANANKVCNGRPCSVKTPNNDQNLRKRFEESFRKSTRLSQEVGLSRLSAMRILPDDLQLFPYKIQMLQRQTDDNKAKRLAFCQDISQKLKTTLVC